MKGAGNRGAWLQGEHKGQINSCISKHLFQNAMSCSRNFVIMKTARTRQTSQSQSQPKRLEYRSPSVAKLGKLANLTLAVGMAANSVGP